jgi:hypothetical protein
MGRKTAFMDGHVIDKWRDMHETQSLKDRRAIDPLLDRRSGNDRRKVRDLEFFKRGGIERRSGVVGRQKGDHSIQSGNVHQAPAYAPKQDYQSDEGKLVLNYRPN